MNSYQDELKKVLLTYNMDKIKEFMYKHNKNMPRNNLAFWAGGTQRNTQFTKLHKRRKRIFEKMVKETWIQGRNILGG